MQQYVDKLERANHTTAFRKLLAQIRWPVSHFRPQLEHVVRKIARTPDDDWTYAYVKKLEKLVSKVKASRRTLVFRQMSLVLLVMLIAFDVSCTKGQKGRSQGGFITTIATRGVEDEPTVCDREHVGRRVCRFGDSTGPPITVGVHLVW